MHLYGYSRNEGSIKSVLETPQNDARENKAKRQRRSKEARTEAM